jgi:hypothetical protein
LIAKAVPGNERSTTRAAGYDEGMNAAFDMRRGGQLLWLLAAFLAWPLWVHSQVAARQPITLVLLDGTTIPVQSLAIAGGKLSGEGVTQGLVLDDLRRIDLAPMGAEPIANPAVQIELRGGGRILGKSVTIANDKCQVEWTGGSPLALPIDALRSVRFDPATPHPEFDKAQLAPAADADRAFLQVDGKTDSVNGLVTGLTAEQLMIQIEGQDRAVPRATVLGIVLAQPQAATEPARCVVELRDGSRLAGELSELANDRARMTLPGGGQVEFPWLSAAKVLVRSSRVAFLSDLKPTDVQERALVTLPRPWRRDRNAMGKPLVLGGRTFEKGIGVHARSSLTFNNDGQFDELAAVIGLDGQGGDKGDCIFVVLGDGERLFARRMTGHDPPHELSLDISGVNEITLVVEPGEGLDLGDVADWADARLIKTKR